MVTETTDNAKAPFNGTAVTGAALGGAALLVQLLSGSFGNVLGGGRPPAGDPPWARDLSYERALTEKDSEIGRLKAEQYADTVVLAAERRLADKIAAIETSTAARFAAQGEYNVANTAAVASTGSQVAQLMRLTGLVINAPTMLASEAGASAFKASSASTASAA
jgi:hypothetical protein